MMIFTRNRKFYDGNGRQVILHGINLVNKNPRTGYLGEVGVEDFAEMRRWGFNCVRLGIIWAGLEPQPGVFNEDYLRGIDQRINWAIQNDLYIILDMHQDLYSELFSDGAPAWATITDGKDHHVVGGVWSDTYFSSSAVQASLDHFWQNSPAEDGIGLQDHYSRAWELLARRYGSVEYVIGCDLMNEPFPGSSAVESLDLLFSKGAQVLNENSGLNTSNISSIDGIVSPEKIAEIWIDPQGRFELLQLLGNKDIYANVIDVTEPVYSTFEKTALMGLYRRIARSIRSVNSRLILFLETSMGSNMGVRSAIEPILDFDEMPDPQQAYAPHGYDLVVDTPNIAFSNQARVELIFERHSETANRLALPMFVGEWGAFDRNIPGTLPAAWRVSHQFERHLCSDTYWHYEHDLNELPPYQAISRPYPERISGNCLHYSYDEKRATFTCTWIETEAVNSPTVIYLPDWFKLDIGKLKLDPLGAGIDIRSTQGGVWLMIYSGNESQKREITIIKG